jgi:hypothetical protein
MNREKEIIKEKNNKNIFSNPKKNLYIMYHIFYVMYLLKQRRKI